MQPKIGSLLKKFPPSTFLKFSKFSISYRTQKYSWKLYWNLERIITMINETFSANLVKIWVQKGIFWNFAGRRASPGVSLLHFGFWWTLQEKFPLSFCWSAPNFKTIALLFRMLRAGFLAYMKMWNLFRLTLLYSRYWRMCQ